MENVAEKVSNRNVVILTLVGVIILLLLYYRRTLLTLVGGDGYEMPGIDIPIFQYPVDGIIPPVPNDWGGSGVDWGETTDLACACSGEEATWYGRPAPMFTPPAYIYIAQPPEPGFDLPPLAPLPPPPQIVYKTITKTVVVHDEIPPPPEMELKVIEPPPPQEYWTIWRDNGHGTHPLYQTSDGFVFLLKNHHYHEHHNFRPAVNWLPKEAYLMAGSDILYGGNRYKHNANKDKTQSNALVFR